MLPAVPEVVQSVRSSMGGPKGARAKAPLLASRAKTPRLERERRILSEPERTETPEFEPDERMLKSARTGRDELRQSLRDHTATGPELTGGDEAPGGDNPTPDQDRVEDIGKALGVTYEDNEELKSADKIAERDRKRWEFDPASSDDWPRKE